MFCKNCGREIAEGVKFCKHCGHPVNGGKSRNEMKSSKLKPHHMLLPLLLVIGGFCVYKLCSSFFGQDSLVGTWYAVSGDTLADELTFTEDGHFSADGTGGTYGIEGNTLILEWNPLYGTYSYEYKIQGRKLYINVFGDEGIYSKNKNFRMEENDIETIAAEDEQKEAEKDKTRRKPSAEFKEDIGAKQEKIESIEPEDPEIYQEFSINADTVTDYGNNILPQNYTAFDSRISDFCFQYPAELYNSVTVNEDTEENVYGTNLKTITFGGSDASELAYVLNERTDSFSISDMTEYIYENEREILLDAEDIINFSNEDHGKVILTGWEYDNDGNKLAVYDLFRVENDYILQMKISVPDYLNEEDRLRKTYVTECLYRLCGFSDSQAAPRSYAEYLEAAN